MNITKRLLSLILTATLTCGIAMAEKATVLFAVDLHCEACVKKIEKNIAFEKGVKDLQCDIEKKTVLVTYDDTKTDIATLQAAFAKIGKPATVKTDTKTGATPAKTDAQSGATTVK